MNRGGGAGAQDIESVPTNRVWHGWGKRQGGGFCCRSDLPHCSRLVPCAAERRGCTRCCDATTPRLARADGHSGAGVTAAAAAAAAAGRAGGSGAALPGRWGVGPPWPEPWEHGRPGGGWEGAALGVRGEKLGWAEACVGRARSPHARLKHRRQVRVGCVARWQALPFDPRPRPGGSSAPGPASQASGGRTLAPRPKLLAPG